MAPVENPPPGACALVTAQSSGLPQALETITQLILPLRAERSKVHLCQSNELLFICSKPLFGGGVGDFVTSTSVQVHRFILRADGPPTFTLKRKKKLFS